MRSSDICSGSEASSEGNIVALDAGGRVGKLFLDSRFKMESEEVVLPSLAVLGDLHCRIRERQPCRS